MLHICYILPIFRIKKAPIGAVACPQWGHVQENELHSYPIAFYKIFAVVAMHRGTLGVVPVEYYEVEDKLHTFKIYSDATKKSTAYVLAAGLS